MLCLHHTLVKSGAFSSLGQFISLSFLAWLCSHSTPSHAIATVHPPCPCLLAWLSRSLSSCPHPLCSLDSAWRVLKYWSMRHDHSKSKATLPTSAVNALQRNKSNSLLEEETVSGTIKCIKTLQELKKQRPEFKSRTCLQFQLREATEAGAMEDCYSLACSPVHSCFAASLIQPKPTCRGRAETTVISGGHSGTGQPNQGNSSVEVTLPS